MTRLRAFLVAAICGAVLLAWVLWREESAAEAASLGAERAPVVPVGTAEAP